MYWVWYYVTCNIRNHASRVIKSVFNSARTVTLQDWTIFFSLQKSMIVLLIKHKSKPSVSLSGFRDLCSADVCRGLRSFLSFLSLLTFPLKLLLEIHCSTLLFFRAYDKQVKLNFSLLILLYIRDSIGFVRITSPASLRILLLFFPLVDLSYTFR